MSENICYKTIDMTIICTVGITQSKVFFWGWQNLYLPSCDRSEGIRSQGAPVLFDPDLRNRKRKFPPEARRA